MDIRPEGFSEAGICTDDLDGWRDFLTDIGGYREIWRGRTPDAVRDHWGLAAGETSRERLLGKPGSDSGLIRLMQFGGGGRQAIRGGAQTWDSGGIFDLDIRVPDVHALLPVLHARGWEDASPAVDWPFGDLRVREWLARGPDAVVLALIQRLAPELDGFDGLEGFSHVFNSSQIVADMPRALDFYEKLGFETVLRHRGPLKGRGGEVLGLSQKEAPRTPVDLMILHPRGTMAGSVELVAFEDRPGRDLSHRALPTNLGLNLLRFPVKDARGYAQQLEDSGIRLEGPVISTTLEPYGTADLFATRAPDGAWLEFYSAVNPT